jgi:hypothetical protein
MKHKINVKFGVVATVILLAALSRVIPHPHNFTPVGAIALFGAAHFRQRWVAFLVPTLSLWISDLVINNVLYREYYPEFTFNPGTLATTYLPFGMIVVLGLFLLKKITPTNVVAASLSASVLFFLVSNFVVWQGSTVYPPNGVGLFLCYEAGLPFFRNGLIGDLFFSGVLFGAYEWAKRQYPVLAVQ